MTRTWTAEQEAWLAESYAQEHIRVLARDFEERFGERRTERSIFQKAHKLGLAKEGRDLPSRAVRPVRWCCEPEMQAWMEANDRGQSLTALLREFRGAFGFPLSRPQINLWRASNGRGTRRSHGGGRERLPVGAERDSRKGYVLVKVAEEPTVPQSKDNWRMKHVLVWERENGPLPDGMDVMFGDRDPANLDPANLVAVPHRLMAMLNGGACPPWWDAESLKAAVSWCELHRSVVRAEGALPRACGVCGREFAPKGESWERGRKTCPDCLAKGLKARGERKPKGKARCAVCGRGFERTQANQRRCPVCVAEAPKRSAKQQRRNG